MFGCFFHFNIREKVILKIIKKIKIIRFQNQIPCIKFTKLIYRQIYSICHYMEVDRGTRWKQNLISRERNDLRRSLQPSAILVPFCLHFHGFHPLRCFSPFLYIFPPVPAFFSFPSFSLHLSSSLCTCIVPEERQQGVVSWLPLAFRCGLCRGCFLPL